MTWPAPWQDEGRIPPLIVFREPAFVQLIDGSGHHHPAKALKIKEDASWVFIRKSRKVQYLGQTNKMS